MHQQREPRQEPSGFARGDSASRGRGAQTGARPGAPAQPGGCLEIWVLTRAAFGVLFWPLLALVGFVLAVVLVIFLFTVHPALALIPVAAIAAALYFFARWEQRRFRPPGIGPP